ncbi:recombinase RecT [Neorhizobium sp. T786]|uniref:recombinase RecT n=1 Tax=Pseudorhizobium xiangyangii TaxID=2883104 RepID=UPI001CFF66D8|nr:recombinase RecT [Neorhizobium xiangyangii]MCB5201678.1 recombinase RecT [Neorhizobium xiangyangii]
MNELTTTSQNRKPLSVFSDMASFADAQRMAKALIHSDLVPVAYRGEDKMGNALIAMDTANRVGVSAIVVMQNLHIIEGRPSWSSSFIISALNSCGLFSPIRFKLEKLGEREVSYDAWEGAKGERRKVTRKMRVKDMTCMAYAVEKDTGEVLEGPEVSIAMAVAEGWYTKPGSKWVTMPDLMIRYRAAAFFGRLYAPHVMNGMQTADEISDAVEIKDITPDAAQQAAAGTEEAKPAGRPRGVHAAMNAGKTAEEVKPRGRKKAEPQTIEGEAEEVNERQDEERSFADGVDNSQTIDGDYRNDDTFGAPGDDEDDDYTPA